MRFKIYLLLFLHKLSVSGLCLIGLDLLYQAKVYKSVCVNDCIKQVFADLSERLTQNRIIYRLWETSQVNLFGDRIQFSQVFYNLVLNSMQAISSGGEIAVNISRKSSYIQILFSDKTGRKYLNLFSPQKILLLEMEEKGSAYLLYGIF